MMPLGSAERGPDRRPVAVAELEAMGLSLQTVNLLEEECEVVYLSDLADADAKHLATIPQLGKVRWILVAITLARALVEKGD